jgi:hypothetical protein
VLTVASEDGGTNFHVAALLVLLAPVCTCTGARLKQKNRRGPALFTFHGRRMKAMQLKHLNLTTSDVSGLAAFFERFRQGITEDGRRVDIN